jgi:hypothetical protein
MITETIKWVPPILDLINREFGRDPRKNWALLRLRTMSSGERLRAELEFAATATREAMLEDIADRLDAVDLSSECEVRKALRWNCDRSRLFVALTFDITALAESALPSPVGMLH